MEAQASLSCLPAMWAGFPHFGSEYPHLDKGDTPVLWRKTERLIQVKSWCFLPSQKGLRRRAKWHQDQMLSAGSSGLSEMPSTLWGHCVENDLFLISSLDTWSPFNPTAVCVRLICRKSWQQTDHWRVEFESGLKDRNTGHHKYPWSAYQKTGPFIFCDCSSEFLSMWPLPTCVCSLLVLKVRILKSFHQAENKVGVATVQWEALDRIFFLASSSLSRCTWAFAWPSG